MAATASQYGLTTFSPSGELLQIKYAQNAVGKGATSLGIKALDGVVVTSEKKTPTPLMDPATIQKVFVLDDHCGCTYSGLGPDSRLLIDKARKVCQVYRKRYHEPMPIPQLTREIAAIFQEFTQQPGVRPFGVSLAIAGVDCTGYHLYQVESSGTFLPWKAVTAGKNAGHAKNFLAKRYSADMEIEDAVNTALLAVKEGLDGAITPQNIEVGVVRDGKFSILTTSQLADYIDQI